MQGPGVLADCTCRPFKVSCHSSQRSKTPSGWVGVVASGVGEVNVAGCAGGIDGQVAQGGEVRRGVAAGLAVVFAEGDVEDVVARLAGPVAMLDLGEVGGAGLQRGQARDRVDEVARFADGGVDRFAVALDEHHLCRAGEVDLGRCRRGRSRHT